MAARGACAMCAAGGAAAFLHALANSAWAEDLQRASATAPIRSASGDAPGTSTAHLANPTQTPAASASPSSTATLAESFLAPARHWKSIGGNKVKCLLCPRHCEVDPGRRGECGVRENRAGAYFTLDQNRIASLHIDPIEKKPLFHFLPGAKALSLAAPGCNFHCKFCQNWQISQSAPEDLECQPIPPAQIARLALAQNTQCIAYTYSEPVVYYELMFDTSEAARRAGVRNVMISNGSIEPGPMRELCEVLDAVKVDFKSFRQKLYREICAGDLRPVLDTMRLVHSLGKWLEIVVLIIPTLNDSPEECRDLCKWVLDNLGPDVPVHFSRFTPNYKLRNLPATPVKRLETHAEIAREAGIHYAYVGNVPGHRLENTYCPQCSEMVISRYGFEAENRLKPGGKCPKCGQAIPGVWS